MARRVFDADGHVIEYEPDLIQFLDPPYNWRGMNGFPLFPTLDGYHRIHIMTRITQKERMVWATAADWVDFMDATGIESTVVYPTAGLGYGLIQDPDWAVVLARGYNNYLYNKFYRESSRIGYVALVPFQDPEEAVKEVRRAVTELSAAGICLAASPSDRGLRKPFGDKSFWPIYEEAEQLGVPIAVHTAVSTGWGFDHFTKFGLTHNLEHPVGQMVAMTSIVMEGVLERFSKLKVAFLEAGVGWALYMLDRMDRSYQTWTGAYGVFQPPSDVARQGRMFFSVEPDEQILPYAVQRLGSECMFFASDFPHEKTKESAIHEIAEFDEVEGLTEQDIDNILYLNGQRFYGKVPAAVGAA